MKTKSCFFSVNCVYIELYIRSRNCLILHISRAANRQYHIDKSYDSEIDSDANK